MSLDFAKAAVLSAESGAEEELLSSACAMNKYKTKLVWQSYQLMQRNCQIIVKDGFNPEQSEDIISRLSEDVMVKPVREGVSIAMRKVNNSQPPAQAFKVDTKVLFESWISETGCTAPILNGQAL
ncbi:hypothetical protein [Psychromonas ossibalaenae]|uniref:hypothetical protein n=1 Tax=Psychromonas ossibalaenae TaxID=444922 RepID=UPI000364C548|nr:hypothetical protein [Psychromonas ossibalaenae]